MSDRFLTVEEYDEQAHELCDSGDFEGALEKLKEGLSVYPNAVELSIGLGYARVAREEYAWARRAFERALQLDASHEDAMVGLGDVLLRLGQAQGALSYFRRALSLAHDDDLELLLTIGRALYREGLYEEARDVFARAATGSPSNAEAAAALGYVFHRLGELVDSGRQIRRALRLDPDLHEARIYLGHLLFDRGDREGALREFERVPPQDHWDALGVWRVIELKRQLWHIDAGDPRLDVWDRRLQELEGWYDPVDALLAEIEARANSVGLDPFDPDQLELFELSQAGAIRRVRLPDGHLLVGTWNDVVSQMRDLAGFAHEGLNDFMRRTAERWHEQSGLDIPFHDPRSFLLAAIRAGLVSLEDESES